MKGRLGRLSSAFLRRLQAAFARQIPKNEHFRKEKVKKRQKKG